MAFTNPCGGLQWETAPDGTINVQGQGVLMYNPGDAKFPWMTQSWANWSNEILDAASARGVPPNWILAIMSLESGLWSGDATKQANVVSSAGARGLMQVMPATAVGLGFTADEMFEPAAAISAGALLLSKLGATYSWELPEVAAAYNSGSACSDGRFTNQWNLAMDGDYAGIVLRFNNSALTYLDLSAKPPVLAGLAIGAAGLYAAALIAGIAAVPRFLRR